MAKKYEFRKGWRLGPGKDDAMEILVLNCVIRYTNEQRGLGVRRGPRQGERLLEGLGLDGNCNPTATPGLQPLLEQLLEDSSLAASEFTGFRGMAARAPTTWPRTASTCSTVPRRYADS